MSDSSARPVKPKGLALKKDLRVLELNCCWSWGVLLVNSSKNKVKLIETGALRSAGSASIVASKHWVGDTVGIFIMATDYTSENPQPNLPHPPRKVIHFKAGFTAADKVLA